MSVNRQSHSLYITDPGPRVTPRFVTANELSWVDSGYLIVTFEEDEKEQELTVYLAKERLFTFERTPSKRGSKKFTVALRDAKPVVFYQLSLSSDEFGQRVQTLVRNLSRGTYSARDEETATRAVLACMLDARKEELHQALAATWPQEFAAAFQKESVA